MGTRIGRLWAYWRTGYGCYLSVPISAAGVLSSVYFLAIERTQVLKWLFPTFSSFVLVGVASVIVFGIAAGWLHYVWSSAFSSELRISVENNPYFFVTTPGKEQNVTLPATAAILDYISRTTTDNELAIRCADLAAKCDHLSKGGKV